MGALSSEWTKPNLTTEGRAGGPFACDHSAVSEITNSEVEAYATEHTSPEPALLTDLAQATREFSRMHVMMVGRLEGRFLKMLVAAVGARRVLEIGTFTGYSALSMAEALPSNG